MICSRTVKTIELVDARLVMLAVGSPCIRATLLPALCDAAGVTEREVAEAVDDLELEWDKVDMVGLHDLIGCIREEKRQRRG